MIEGLNHLYLVLMMHINNFIEEEKGAVDLITVVVLIGIAIVLAVIFKDKMKSIVESLLGNIQSSAQSAMQ